MQCDDKVVYYNISIKENYMYFIRILIYLYIHVGALIMNKISILDGKREVIELNKHKVIVIAPKKLIPYEKGCEKLRKLLVSNK